MDTEGNYDYCPIFDNGAGLLSDIKMDYPLGNTIGNSLEVMEAYRTLDGKGNRDFTNLCIIFFLDGQ